MKKLLALLPFIFMLGCFSIPNQRVENTLDEAGYTNVRLHDDAYFACSDSDEYLGRRFTATNFKGRSVSGVVCCGVFKSCTIRF